ncbi:MAG TPA: hypothetical protein VMS96_09330 [Terriglobales bacterium]|nr:hypothetical protein [Terriglobales bacterium]
MGSMDNLQYRWDELGFPTPASRFTFSHCTREPLSWTEELEKAAIDLAKSARRPIWICSSGGVDSETLCEIFLRLNLSFKVLTLEFVDGKNAHDIVHAKQWCKQHGVAQELYPFDIFDFVKNELDQYIEEGYVAGELFRYLMVKEVAVVDEMGGFAVLAGGEQLYHVDGSREVLTAADPYLQADITYTTPLEWCRRHGVRHEPYFYFSTPEIMLAWLRIPLVDFVLHHPDYFRHPTNKHALKNSVIRYHFPQQQWRNKCTGFEQVLNLDALVRAKLVEHFGARVQKSRLYVSELLQQLQPIAEPVPRAFTNAAQ